MKRKGYKCLTYADRLKIEAWELAHVPRAKQAEYLGTTRQTIYNELKRGQYEHLNMDYTTEYRYSPDIAQRKCDENLAVRGVSLKIGNDIAYADYIEQKIAEDGYSPAAVLGELKATGQEKQFQTKICVKTLYNYIDKGVFLTITNKSLPVKGRRTKRKNKIRIQRRANAGTSIEKRDKDILTRKEFGHWEMDSVVGKRGKSKCPLLVFTERKTRQEFIFKLKNHTTREVVKTINRLERHYQKNFPEIFKTITVDNGPEFAACTDMEKSCLHKGSRTKIYYCHPYSSWERGGNENANKLIRRHIPKGTDFDGKTKQDIRHIEDWINNYPRKILDYHCSQELFNEEINRIMQPAQQKGMSSPG